MDRRANALIGRWPELNAAVASRILRRSRQLSYSMASHHFFCVDDRLTAVLWRIALMWGRVRTDGILIPFRLSHEMLAEIICARRPSVTLAIGSLERDGRILRTPDKRLVVLGSPPAWASQEPRLDGDEQALASSNSGAGCLSGAVSARVSVLYARIAHSVQSSWRASPPTGDEIGLA